MSLLLKINAYLPNFSIRVVGIINTESERILANFVVDTMNCGNWFLDTLLHGGRLSKNFKVKI